MEKKPTKRWIPIAFGAFCAVAVVIGLIAFILHTMEKKDTGPKRQTAQVVKLIRPPPPPEQPPRPPPPPEEKIEEPLPQDTPEERPTEEAPPAEQLGLDADGSAGSDGFGLAARKGGRDLLGGGGAAFAWYTGLLKDTVLDTLSENERVRRGSYAVIVRIWVANDGRVERVQLAQATGNRELDGAIEQALAKVARVREAPPLEMPQPVTLKIVSRG